VPLVAQQPIELRDLDKGDRRGDRGRRRDLALPHRAALSAAAQRSPRRADRQPRPGDASTADFNTGRTVNGTGPYRFVEFVPGDRIVLQRNDAYWGERAQWARVTLRIINNDAARVAALLAGDVQVMDNVPPDAIARVRGNANLALAQTLSNRLIYLHIDSSATSRLL